MPDSPTKPCTHRTLDQLAALVFSFAVDALGEESAGGGGFAGQVDDVEDLAGGAAVGDAVGLDGDDVGVVGLDGVRVSGRRSAVSGCGRASPG